jgi:hypothetical protein
MMRGGIAWAVGLALAATLTTSAAFADASLAPAEPEATPSYGPRLDGLPPRRSPFVIAGVLTLIGSSLQIPAGIVLFAAEQGSCLELDAGFTPGGFGSCSGHTGLAALGVVLAVSGGVGLIAGSVILGVGIGENREWDARHETARALLPTVAPLGRGAALTWSF